MARKKKVEPVAEVTAEVTEAAESSDLNSSFHVPEFDFDFLADDNKVASSIKDIMQSVAARKKNYSVDFKTMGEVRQAHVPFNHFLFEHFCGTPGLPYNSLIEIIGAEGLGKSSLALQFLGWAMNAGCPALYIDCESKQIPKHRVLRCLHHDPQRAVKMLNKLQVEKATTLERIDALMVDFLKVARGINNYYRCKDSTHVPMHVPIVICIDPWSKLMNPAEAVGFDPYAKVAEEEDGEKKQTERILKVHEGSNLGHAKWAHGWCRRLPSILTKYNAVLILVHHQNTKLDLTSKPSWMHTVLDEALTDNSFNKTKIGGNAFNQSAALQFILSKGGNSIKEKLKGRNEITGKQITIRLAKNSFGADNNAFKYELRTHHFLHDTDDYLEPALDFDTALADLFVTNKWLNTKLEGGLYLCDSISDRPMHSHEFINLFHANKEVRNKLGKLLNIEGYVDTVDLIRSTLSVPEILDEEEREA